MQSFINAFWVLDSFIQQSLLTAVVTASTNVLFAEAELISR